MDEPDPFDERPATLKMLARKLRRRARSLVAEIPTRGDEARKRITNLLHEADRLVLRAERKQGDEARATTRPPNRYTERWASGAAPGEPIQAFPRALRRTLLELDVSPDMADKIVERPDPEGEDS